MQKEIGRLKVSFARLVGIRRKQSLDKSEIF